MTDELAKKIRILYSQGMTYKDIKGQLNVSMSALSKILKGTRSASEAAYLCYKKGRRIIDDEFREKCSKNGKKSCITNKKFWTVPEQKFKKILNDLSIGVKFPDYIKKIINIEDDENPEIYFQYPLQRYVCDFVDLNRKVVYCINGDYWHANPILYEEKLLTKSQLNNVQKDKNRSIFLNKNGFSICNIWESELNWNLELVKQKIWATRKTANPLVLHTGKTAFDSQVAYLNQDWSNILKKLWIKPKKIIKSKVFKLCKNCNIKYCVNDKKQKYCSTFCSSYFNRKVVRPSKEELANYLKFMSKEAIGKKYNVSGRTIGKWAKSYKI